MTSFTTQALKDQAIADQKVVVDNATPATLAAEKAKLADLKAATV